MSRKSPRAVSPEPVAPAAASVRRQQVVVGAVLVAFLLLGLGAGWGFGSRSDKETATPAAEGRGFVPLPPGSEFRQGMHEHADFGVFVRGDKLDFNQEQFLSTEDVERSENVHVHAPRTNVAHVHREQTTWDEFFVSLGMEITDECLILADEQRLCESPIEPLRFVVNGVEVDTIRFQSLSDLDRVAIIFGSDETASRQLAATVSDEACIPSESCKNRIDPNNPEKEPCRKSESACH